MNAVNPFKLIWFQPKWESRHTMKTRPPILGDFIWNWLFLYIFPEV
jgi:hypothetical protein